MGPRTRAGVGLLPALRRHLDGDVLTDAPLLEWREWRWFALLPGHVVFVADGGEAWSRLRREAVLLRAARAALGCIVPEVVIDDDQLRLQVRQRMSGVHGYAIEEKIFGVHDSRSSASGPGWVKETAGIQRYAEDCPLTDWGRTFAGDLGCAVARLHGALAVGEARAIRLGERRVDWSAISRALTSLPQLARALPRLQAWDASRPIDRVVTHGDPHFFNLFADDAGHLVGMIDLDDAAIGDRHEDLRYVHSNGPHFARLVIDAYSREAGVAIDARIVARLHVCNAFEHFAWVAPDAPRFPSIVAWATEALHALAPELR